MTNYPYSDEEADRYHEHMSSLEEANAEAQRKLFEAFISSPPFEKDVSRYPNDHDRFAWPGSYRDISVDLAWNAWVNAISTERSKIVFLVTCGTGSEGDEWELLGVHATRESAEVQLNEYQKLRTRQDGSTYRYLGQIEEWEPEERESNATQTD